MCRYERSKSLSFIPLTLYTPADIQKLVNAVADLLRSFSVLDA